MEYFYDQFEKKKINKNIGMKKQVTILFVLKSLIQCNQNVFMNKSEN